MASTAEQPLENSPPEERPQETAEEKTDDEDEGHKMVQAQNPITPAIHKRRKATAQSMIQSPTDNIFSPVSKKLIFANKHK